MTDTTSAGALTFPRIKFTPGPAGTKRPAKTFLPLEHRFTHPDDQGAPRRLAVPRGTTAAQRRIPAQQQRSAVLARLAATRGLARVRARQRQRLEGLVDD